MEPVESKLISSTIDALNMVVKNAQQALQSLQSTQSQQASQKPRTLPRSFLLPARVGGVCEVGGFTSANQRLVLTYQGMHQNPIQLVKRDQLPTVDQLWQLDTNQRIQLGNVARYLWTQSFIEMSTNKHCETPDRFGEVFDTLTRDTRLVRLVPISEEGQYEAFDSTRYAVFVADIHSTSTQTQSTKVVGSREASLSAKLLGNVQTESSVVLSSHALPPCQTIATHASLLPAMPTKCDKRVDFTQGVETPTPVFDYAYRIQLHGAYDRLCKLFVISQYPPLRASLDVVATTRRGQKLECFTMLSHERRYQPTFLEQQRRQAYQGKTQLRFWPLMLLHQDTPLPLRYLQHLEPSLVCIFVDVHITWLTNIHQPPMLMYQVDEALPPQQPDETPAWVATGAYPTHMYTEQQTPIEKSLVFKMRSE